MRRRFARRIGACAAWCALAAGALAQAGDRAGEEQPGLPPGLAVPPAPVLAPEKEARTFRIAEGLALELVAAEPLVCDPIALAWDADGSLWVVEMRAYMPDVDGQGEREPNGCVVRLHDDDGDGRMDRRVVFLDGLVLPRAVAPTRGGVLVIAPPKLLFARDEDGDGAADDVQVVDQGLEGIQSPEHAINGLLPTLDNAFACSNAPWRYVWRDAKWQRERTSGGGQWGTTKDDEGRLYTNNNSDPLRVDAIGGVYAARNPNLGNASGVNARVVDDMRTRPARMTPGVNRGYQQGVLDGEFKLASVTAACAPWVVRGTALGEEYRGNALVCEPAGNLVLRYRLRETDAGGVSGEPVRNADGLDWLTSTDERFRPVGLCDGPDGALYVCDMYRGVIQHKLFVTSFLRKQVKERALEAGIGMGRVWRVVRKGIERKPLDLAAAEPGDLVASLASANGWTRDTAQRLLVEEWESSAAAHERVREAAQFGKGWRTRVHALWALAGMGGVTKDVAESALGSDDARVRCAGLKVSERLAAEDEAVLGMWKALTKVQPGGARALREVVLSLGNVKTERGLQLLVDVMREGCEWAEVRSAAASGLGGRELEALNAIARSWSSGATGRTEFIALLAKCVAREARGDRLEGLVGLSAAATGERAWMRAPLVQGVLDGRPKDGLGKPTWIRVARRPEGLAGGLEDAFAWPGKAGAELERVRELTQDESARFERGRALYESTCVQCHLGSGMGMTGQAPPLRGSKWVLGDAARPARILLSGLKGPIEVDGEGWDGEMPAVGFGDEDMAAVLTYVRREWGNGAEPVTAEIVREVRKQLGTRKDPWTVKELETAR